MLDFGHESPSDQLVRYDCSFHVDSSRRHAAMKLLFRHESSNIVRSPSDSELQLGISRSFRIFAFLSVSLKSVTSARSTKQRERDREERFEFVELKEFFLRNAEREEKIVFTSGRNLDKGFARLIRARLFTCLLST